MEIRPDGTVRIALAGRGEEGLGMSHRQLANEVLGAAEPGTRRLVLQRQLDIGRSAALTPGTPAAPIAWNSTELSRPQAPGS
jgi:hypothetical protein